MEKNKLQRTSPPILTLNPMKGIPSSSNTTSALWWSFKSFKSHHMISWFSDGRVKSMLCSIVCSEAFVETRPGGLFNSYPCSSHYAWIIKSKDASWNGGPLAWEHLLQEVSRFQRKDLLVKARWVFVSVFLAAEVDQAAEDEKEAAECSRALSSWSRVSPLLFHGAFSPHSTPRIDLKTHCF